MPDHVLFSSLINTMYRHSKIFSLLDVCLVIAACTALKWFPIVRVVRVGQRSCFSMRPVDVSFSCGE